MMNKKLFRLTCLLIAIFVFNGCSDDSDESQEMINSYIVCTMWGVSMPEVMDYMKDSRINTRNMEYICYDGNNGIRTVSYYFQNKGLQASLLLIPETEVSLSELQASFDEYEYLGEKNSLDIYINESENTLVTIGKKVKEDNVYYAVGYTMLDAENM